MKQTIIDRSIRSNLHATTMILTVRNSYVPGNDLIIESIDITAMGDVVLLSQKNKLSLLSLLHRKNNLPPQFLLHLPLLYLVSVETVIIRMI
jgi:hypothetical protein